MDEEDDQMNHNQNNDEEIYLSDNRTYNYYN